MQFDLSKYLSILCNLLRGLYLFAHHAWRDSDRCWIYTETIMSESRASFCICMMSCSCSSIYEWCIMHICNWFSPNIISHLIIFVLLSMKFAKKPHTARKIRKCLAQSWQIDRQLSGAGGAERQLATQPARADMLSLDLHPASTPSSPNCYLSSISPTSPSSSSSLSLPVPLLWCCAH